MIKSMVCGGGVDVQTYNGTFTTSNNGKASINCGFKPDLLVFYTANGNGYECVGALPIKERKTSRTLNTVAWAPTDDISFIDFDLTSLSDTGATVGVYLHSSGVYGEPYARKTISYRAVKYSD